MNEATGFSSTIQSTSEPVIYDLNEMIEKQAGLLVTRTSEKIIGQASDEEDFDLGPEVARV